MMKDWSKFNEGLYKGDIFDILDKNIDVIRDVFIYFEDLNIVTYGFCFINGVSKGSHPIQQPGHEMSVGFLFEPNGSNPHNRDVHDFLHSCSNLIVEGDTACIRVFLKFPAEVGSKGNSQLNSDGIKLLDEVLSASDRLLSEGYDVKLDLNGNHHQYKPMEFKIYFKLI